MSRRNSRVVALLIGLATVAAVSGCSSAKSGAQARADRAAFAPPIVVAPEFASQRVVASDGSGRSLNWHNRAAQASAGTGE